MKIKLAILEKDVNYLNRMISVFGAKYADKLELYSFTELPVAMASLESTKIDVLIADDSFDIDGMSLPDRCGFAYFVDSASVDTVNNQKAICKFQKAELIYKQILSIYSEKSGSISELKLYDNGTKIIIFNSISGGTGASSIAAASALFFASQGKRPLYLSLEKFGSADSFFAAEGQFDMSDIIFAIKSKTANLPLKLESCVKQDARGVYFYSQSKIAMDMFDLNWDEIKELISELKGTGSYDYIILDMDFALDNGMLQVCKQAHHIVWIGDGSEISNSKIIRAYTALATLEQNLEVPLINKLRLIYNKFSNKTGKIIQGTGIVSAGGIPKYEQASTGQVVNHLIRHISEMELFERM